MTIDYPSPDVLDLFPLSSLDLSLVEGDKKSRCLTVGGFLFSTCLLIASLRDCTVLQTTVGGVGVFAVAVTGTSHELKPLTCS